LDKMEKIVTSQ